MMTHPTLGLIRSVTAILACFFLFGLTSEKFAEAQHDTNSVRPSESTASARDSAPVDSNSVDSNSVDSNSVDSNQSSRSPAVDQSESGSGQKGYQDQDSPALGVLVGSCPGKGVCVLQTMLDSPAAEADIRAGDYILAINDQQVNSPRELQATLAALESTGHVNVLVWRRGRKVAKQVALASVSKKLPESRRGWLGVLLLESADSQATGVTIQEVYPDSPADAAGLKTGDLVVRINGETIATSEQLVDAVEGFQPGDMLKLAVTRNGEIKHMKVVLGDVSAAPMQWFRQSFRPPFGDAFKSPQSSESSMTSDRMVDEMLDELREQVRALQEQVNELSRPVPPPVDSKLDGLERDEIEQPDNNDFSSFQASSAQLKRLIVDRGDQPVQTVQFDASRGFKPNISNDWTRSRYRNGGQWDSGQRSRSFYRLPSPRYRVNPYRYYRHGGRPYYYGGSFPYGYRGGVHIGPNFGIWW